MNNIKEVILKLKNKLLNVSIFIKIFGIAVGGIILFYIISIYIIHLILNNVLRDNLIKTWQVSGQHIVEQLNDKIIIDDLVGVNNMIKYLNDNYKDLRYVILFGKNGQIIDSTFGLIISDELYKVNLMNLDGIFLKEIETDEGIIYDLIIPAVSSKLDYVRFGIKKSIIDSEIQRSILQISSLMGFILFIAFILLFNFSKILYTPIRELMNGIKQVAIRNFSIRIKPWADDELGELSKLFNNMAENLAEKDKELAEKEKARIKLIERIISAQEEERMRLSRELHDTVNQLFSLIKISLQSLTNSCRTRALKLKAEKAKVLINNAMEEIYNISKELRPPLLKDFGLFKSVREYIREFCLNYNIKIKLDINCDENLRLNETMEIGIFRVIQEALINIHKHSKANEVRIKFNIKNNILILIISDNGKGFLQSEIRHKGIGIVGMIERINILGGKIKIFSQLNKGTIICVKVKIK